MNVVTARAGGWRTRTWWRWPCLLLTTALIFAPPLLVGMTVTPMTVLADTFPWRAVVPPEPPPNTALTDIAHVFKSMADLGRCTGAPRYRPDLESPAKIAIVRDTWPNLRDTTMATFFTWFPPGVMGELHKTDKVFTLRTEGAPSHILFRALDDEKDIRNVLSLELAAAALEEPQGGSNTKGGADPGIAESLYRSLLGRVGRQAGYPLKMLWMAGNPPSPSHWIAKEFGTIDNAVMAFSGRPLRQQRDSRGCLTAHRGR